MIRKQKARRPLGVRHARRERERAGRAQRRAAIDGAVRRAGNLVRPVLDLANGIDTKRMVRAAAFLRRTWEGDAEPGTGREAVAAMRVARGLLESWRPRLAARLVKGIEVSAEYYLTKSGDVDIGTHYSAGTLSQFVALSLGYARGTLRAVDAWERRVKRCANPSCRKWFFDGGRGTQAHCCAGCANAHQQLKRSATYDDRRKRGEYDARPCRRC